MSWQQPFFKKKLKVERTHRFHMFYVTLQSFTWASWHQCKVYLVRSITQSSRNSQILHLYLGELLTEKDKDGECGYNSLWFESILKHPEETDWNYTEKKRTRQKHGWKYCTCGGARPDEGNASAGWVEWSYVGGGALEETGMSDQENSCALNGERKAVSLLFISKASLCFLFKKVGNVHLFSFLLA